MAKKLAENSAAEPVKRGRGPGRPFPKGSSANPGGRPKDERDVINALRLKGAELVEALLRLALDPKEPNVKAIAVALDRAYGKAKETVDLKATVKREIDFDKMPPEKAEKVTAVLGQLEALLRADNL